MAYNRTIMNREYHTRITQQALETYFSPTALAKIIEASLNQDRLSGQIGHDEYHFDNNAFDKSYVYIEEQRALVISRLLAGDPPSAWAAFGRLIHTAQDFYAHSNYIHLWLSRQDEARPAHSEVDPLDQALLHSPDLRSGRVYLPWELLTYLKPLKPFILPLLPCDSHAWMNLDSPERGFHFGYAMHAAIKRTALEFEKTTSRFSQDLAAVFVDK